MLAKEKYHIQIDWKSELLCFKSQDQALILILWINLITIRYLELCIPCWGTLMKRSVIDPQIKSAYTGYQDQAFKINSIHINFQSQIHK